MDQHEEVEAVEPNDSAEQVDPRDEKLRIWKFSLQKPRLANATPCCASKRKWKTCAVVLNRISKKRINSLSKFVNELLPVIDSPDRALEVADKANPDMAAMVEGIELTLKSMLDVVRKFGVEVIAETNVPLDERASGDCDGGVGRGSGRQCAGYYAERLYAERSYHSRGDGDCSEGEVKFDGRCKVGHF